MKLKVKDLFVKIYPKDKNIANKMAFEIQNKPRYVAAKVAIDEQIIGQANVFKIKGHPHNANIGYHVHPDYRRKSIGYKLCSDIISDIRKDDIKQLLIRTKPNNKASISMTKKLGF